MTVDIGNISYSVEFITEKGERINLTPVLTGLSWEERDAELAQRAQITVHNVKYGNAYLMSLCKLNCLVRIFADWGQGKTCLMEGVVWSWDYASAENKELSITVYDPLIRLQKSKDFKYYSDDIDTKTIVEDICNDWSIPLNFDWDSIAHEKKVFSGQTLSDMILNVLEDVKKRNGTEYVISYRLQGEGNGALCILHQGTNAEVYTFTIENVISTNNQVSMDRLVTKVKIYGHAKSGERRPLNEEITGKTEFGVIQEIVLRDSVANLEDARKDANVILKERGEPEETIRVVAPDLPFLRKGDKVKVEAGNLIGAFFVTGVTHEAFAGRMTMELTRAKA